MCFPFDLTDEQLAAAFNETFNIVDFSGVEIKEADEEAGTPKKLVLHFNNVAKTYYRDNKGNEYEVIGREVDPVSKFSYNIYRRDGVEYHHSQVSDLLSTNKTKTFAPGNSISESNTNKANAIIIDGVLATAGHPYMIHPAIGTSIGNPKRCDFSGVSWKPMTQWPDIFEAQKRTIDLGVAMGDQSTFEPDENNFFQAEYSDYAGQTYTFIGNAKEYRDDAQAAIGNEPQVPEEPVLATQGDAPNDPSSIVGARLTAADEPQAPEVVANPADDTTTYPANFQTLYNAAWQNSTMGELIIANNNPKDLGAQDYWAGGLVMYNDNNPLTAYFGNGNQFQQSDYAALQSLCSQFKTALDSYNSYSTLYAQYEADHQTWQANIDAWTAYDAAYAKWEAFNPATAQAEYEQAQRDYEAAVAAHDAWEATAKAWLTYIPKHSYFLGRRGTALPKYYREVADDPEESKPSTRTGGVWTQFTAIVIPNDAAVAGIESELDGKTASSKGFDMAFDEGFLGEIIEQDDVVTLIEKAQEEGAKVEYMDIVVSINGEVVRRGTTSIEGLPKGIYIVNGKKYFVK